MLTPLSLLLPTECSLLILRILSFKLFLNLHLFYKRRFLKLDRALVNWLCLSLLSLDLIIQSSFRLDMIIALHSRLSWLQSLFPPLCLEWAVEIRLDFFGHFMELFRVVRLKLIVLRLFHKWGTGLGTHFTAERNEKACIGGGAHRFPLLLLTTC